MDDFEQNLLAARLPKDALASGQIVLPSCMPQHGAVVSYLTCVVEALPELDPMTEGLEDLMEALRGARVPSPIVAQDVAEALEALPKEVAKRYLAIPDFYPRVLKTLNGPDFCLVGAEEVAEAAHREQVMRGMPHGWGVAEAPMYAVAYRLLVSSGVDERHLPKYKTLPVAIRGRLMAAWNGACKTLGWTPYNPDSDLKADARLATARAAACTQSGPRHGRAVAAAAVDE